MPPASARDLRRHGRPQFKRISRVDFTSQAHDLEAPLTGLDLAGFDLRKEPLKGRDLSGSNLAETRLEGVDLENANLSRCVFARADLHGTRLVRTDLRGADLATANGLTPDQLRDSLLGSAKLPENFAFDGLDRVRDLVNRGERQLQALLLACVSMGVIAAATGHSQFFRSNNPLTLPGLDLPVQLNAFFVLAPLVLLGMFLSVSFTLRKLWYELANLPAQFPNRRGLYEQAAPSTPSFTAPAALHLAGRIEDYGSAWPERRLMVFLVWWLTPITLLLFAWAAYLPRHDAPGTWWHVLVTVGTAWWGVRSYRKMDFLLSGRFRTPQPPHGRRARVGNIRIYPRGTRAAGDRPRRGMLGVAVLGVLLVGASLWAMDDVGCASLTGRATERPHPGCTLFAARLAHADLDGIRLFRGNLRRAFIRSAQLRDADLEDARLEYATLSLAVLSRAQLKDAHLQRAVLWEATLDSAKMKETKLMGADLRGATLRYAQLQGADFTGANLQGVIWTGAIVCGATFTPGRVDPTALREARGWERAVGTGIVAPPYRRTDPPPSYLTRDEKQEYVRWRRAWLAARVTPPPLVNGRVQYEPVRAYLRSLDLSMGESRQREKEVLLAELDEMRRLGTLKMSAVGLVAGIERLRSSITTKAANHCVDVRENWPPAGGGSGRPAGRGPAEK